jgi:hypothetical protein
MVPRSRHALFRNVQATRNGAAKRWMTLQTVAHGAARALIA